MRFVVVVLGCLAAFSANMAWAQTSPSNFTSATRYDLAGRVVGQISPDPDGSFSGPVPFQAVRNTYDAAGRLIRIEKGWLDSWKPESILPENWGANFHVDEVVDTTYDGMDRKTSEAVSSGGTTYQFRQFSYDAVGRLECSVVRMNAATFGTGTGACSLTTPGTYGSDRITHYVYDSAGQLLKEQRAYGTPLQQDYVTYEYTPNGKQKAVIDAKGNRAELTWDGFDRQAAWYFPSATTAGVASTTDFEAYGYDPNGNRTSLKKRDGRSINYDYDALNRLKSKTYPSGGARAVYYSYDLRGLQTAARFDSDTGTDAVLSTWDGFGRQISSTTAMSGTSRTLSYIYNANGGRTKITFPSGDYVNIHRYDTGELYYTDLNGALPLFHAPLTQSGRVGAVYRWGVSAADWSIWTGFGYDGIGRLIYMGTSFATSSNNQVIFLERNPANQVIGQFRQNDSDYAFNAYVDVSRSYVSDGLNQYVVAGPATFSYDANGNLTADGTAIYGYDIENRLTSVSNGASLTYDPTGRLWQTSSPTTGATQLLYDGDNLVAEYDAAGNVLQRYVHGDGPDDPQVMFSGTGGSGPYYLFADQLGSIVAITDANGNVGQINRYDEYGIPGAGNAGRFQYTGQAWLPEVGMYYYKARMYSPTLGRFMQTDPIGYDDQINLYAYVGNDPINGRDPSGESEEFVISATLGCGVLCVRLADAALRYIAFSQLDSPAIGPADILAAAGFLYAAYQILKNEAVDVTDPDSVEGADPDDVKKAAEAKFGKGRPANNGKGVVYSSGSGNEGIRVMEGGGSRTGKNDREGAIKEGGPYAVIFGGKAGKRYVPLAGNRALGK